MYRDSDRANPNSHGAGINRVQDRATAKRMDAKDKAKERGSAHIAKANAAMTRRPGAR